MKNRELQNHLRTHRRKSGLSQRQIGHLLGYPDEVQVSRHERAEAIPLLVIAFGYQAIFRVPVHILFPGVYESVWQSVEERLRELEVGFQGLTVKGREAEAIAQALIWMMERRELDIDMADGG
jgi:hypothetical protein